MKTKLEIAQEFIKKNINIFRCPICNTNFEYKNSALCCVNNHNFDLNKKGSLCLLNSSNLRKSKIYNIDLFNSRRTFIEGDFYKKVHEKINNIIKDKFKNQKVTVLDLGSGEGIHVQKILKNINNTLIGFDYSKDAINLSTSYYSENAYYFIGDVNNIPLVDNSIDCIIDFLSPFNEGEINRILKKDGIFIKVVPGKKYLLELRNAYNIKEYQEKDLIEKKYKNFTKIELNDTYQIDEENLNNLIKMTPMKFDNRQINIEKITINVLIYVIKGCNNYD